MYYCECGKPAAVYEVDRAAVVVKEPLQPGQIIECNDPKSLHAYCDDCWLGVVHFV